MAGGVMISWLSLLHNFIQQRPNSGSTQVLILLKACQKFATVRTSDSGSEWKEGLKLSVGKPRSKRNLS